jgi:hypothetical protein
MTTTLFRTSKDIEIVLLSRWLDWACSNVDGPFIALPMIQRGSVWRPHQVIDLWDSLLQGMPIGSMMVSELKEGTSARQPGKNHRVTVSANGGLALVDGQQRTLAMLIAWSRDVEMDRRLWVDFSDEPAPGQLLRLRMTTANQPFGFKVSEPSSKLSLSDRHSARSAFEQVNGKSTKIGVDNAWPFSHRLGLSLDLCWLLDLWKERKGDINVWTDYVTVALHNAVSPRLLDRDADTWANELIWPRLSDVEKSRSLKAVQNLATGLSRLFEVEMPLIHVPERFFETTPDEDSDPPLATLFKRIGTGGTPLSDADYVYSVIKHLRPESYDLVESLQGQNRTVASLLTATDLVMSTVRLAAVGWNPADGRPVADLESPNKRDFHRLLRRGDFIDDRFLPLIRGAGQSSPIAKFFDTIQSTLLFRGGNDPGLPKQAFPLLKRPLVQVLLLLAQHGHMKSGTSCRNDILRLVMYWIVAVTDPAKASRLAFEIISSSSDACGEIGKLIHDRLLAEWVGVRVPDPQELELKANPVASLREKEKMLGESRFHSTEESPERSALLQFYRNHWWQPWTHEHPILLWLQRKMVSTRFDTEFDPLAGRDEDTPYDYDHILPHDHWGGWTGARRGTTLLDFTDGQIHVVGNGIGNIRVWGSSLNRSDGSKPPGIKLKLESDDTERSSLLSDSCIDIDQIDSWIVASGLPGNYRSWSKERALSFQTAVEQRAAWLYRSFYDDLGFASWAGPPYQNDS